MLNRSSQRLALRIVGILMVIGIIVFTYSRISQYIKGPFLSEVSLTTPTQTSDPVLPVSGTIENTDVITINDRPIGVSEEGDFNETVVLVPGSNIIELQLGDTFGKQRSYRYHIYLDAETPYIPLLQQALDQQENPNDQVQTTEVETESIQ